MKHLFFAAGCIVLATVIPATKAADDWVLPTAEPLLKNAAGVEVASAQCILCHSVDYITTQPPLTRDQWKAIVTKMQQKFAAPLTADKVEPLLDYLAKNYGK